MTDSKSQPLLLIVLAAALVLGFVYRHRLGIGVFEAIFLTMIAGVAAYAIVVGVI